MATLLRQLLIANMATPKLGCSPYRSMEKWLLVLPLQLLFSMLDLAGPTQGLAGTHT